ncbi:YybH family protein [Streptomyces sp. NPDC060020]|uniref:YybH family protein n=1 Tax=unclassified Streptomyces TaxID=2593676 RepID=UPI00368B373A
MTTDPRQHPAVFAAAFNTGEPAAVAQVYESDAVFVPRPGVPLTGTELASATAGFLALGLPIEVSPRHTYTAGDLALLVVDWRIEGTGPDGAAVRLAGTATDVARRGPDGLWRYVIDNPFGTSPA